jgi:SET domain-containing protein
VIVRRSGISGRGGFAGRRLRRGEFVIEYTGEHITEAEADRRYDDKPYTYLFDLAKDVVIDGAAGGNDARFINHSCEPNCDAWEEGRRIVIRASRTIRPGEELSYDYALPRDPKLGKEEDALYPCSCGARRCRGTILAPPKKRRRRPRKRPAG